ncbi:REX4, RNA exonuclease 4 [Dinochytrium kinnereticum]|nr:REX4, RNA exonuclease 4 [Dinochytrium kinnereticum]
MPSNTILTETPWYKGVQDPLAKWFLNFAKDTDNRLQFKLGMLDQAITEGIEQLNKGAGPPPYDEIVAIDCEMVQVGVPPDAAAIAAAALKPPTAPGLPSTPAAMQSKVALARVSIVDFNGKVLLDTFCKPKEEILDFKTKYSGVTAEDLIDAPSVKTVQRMVAKLVKNSYIVGQSLENDVGVLELTVPAHRLRDTALYYKRFHPRGKAIGLRDLAKLNLGLDIQQGAHDSVRNHPTFFIIIDARVAMLLYRQLRSIWEKSMPIYDCVIDPDSCFPVPVSFPLAFREAIAIAASTDPTLPLQPLSKALSEGTLLRSFTAEGFPISEPPISHITSSNLPTSPATPRVPIHVPTKPTTPTVAVPVVVKSKQDLKSTTAEPLTASSDMILRTFYDFLPREQKLMKFSGFPMWLVPEGVHLPAESRILLADVKKALQKAPGLVAEKPVKVDTSLPGKRKRMMLEAKAKAEAEAALAESKTDMAVDEINGIESSSSDSRNKKRKMPEAESAGEEDKAVEVESSPKKKKKAKAENPVEEATQASKSNGSKKRKASDTDRGEEEESALDSNAADVKKFKNSKTAKKPAPVEEAPVTKKDKKKKQKEVAEEEIGEVVSRNVTETVREKKKKKTKKLVEPEDSDSDDESEAQVVVGKKKEKKKKTKAKKDVESSSEEESGVDEKIKSKKKAKK